MTCHPTFRGLTLGGFGRGVPMVLPLPFAALGEALVRPTCGQLLMRKAKAFFLLAIRYAEK